MLAALAGLNWLYGCRSTRQPPTCITYLHRAKLQRLLRKLFLAVELFEEFAGYVGATQAFERFLGRQDEYKFPDLVVDASMLSRNGAVDVFHVLGAGEFAVVSCLDVLFLFVLGNVLKKVDFRHGERSRLR